METTIIEYSPTAAALAKMREKFFGATYEVATTAGMDAAKRDRRELVTLRTDLEKKRVEIKAPALERCKQIDAEAKRITAEIESLEKPIDDQIKAEEAKKEAIRLEKERQAAAAQKILDDKILEIGKLPLRCIGKTAEEIQLFLATLEARPFGAEFTGATLERAEMAKAEAITEIRLAYEAAIEAEETARITVIRGAISAFKVLEDQSPGLSIQYLTDKIAELEDMAICEDFFQEFRAEAQNAKISALQTLSDELSEKTAAAAAFEKQQAELAAQQQAQAEKEEAFRKEQEAFRKEQEKAQAAVIETARIDREKKEALAAEERAKQEAIDKAERDKERLAALEAEKKRVEAEQERKAAEKARKLALAKLGDATTALKKILSIVQDDTRNETQALAEIAVIAEANI